uniref:Uncharacterized protein n=1 Tax=Anguilla anguilla TaxID=7936 RepID=A0A0E9W487_ANGAN
MLDKIIIDSFLFGTNSVSLK